jgi:hypothetical protein
MHVALAFKGQSPLVIMNVIPVQFDGQKLTARLFAFGKVGAWFGLLTN